MNQFSSVAQSCQILCDPHGLQHARLPCPSPTPGVCSNSCPSSQWCHPTISSSVIPFSSYLQSFPASGSFPLSQFFASGGQSIGVSASASVLPMNIQDWFPLGLTGLISFASGSKGRSQSNIVLVHGQEDLALGSMLRRVPYTMRSRRMCLVEIALGSSGQCRQSPEPRVLPFVGQLLVWFKDCSGPREINLCCSSHCIFKTKGNYLWTPWGFSGCASSDLGEATASEGQEDLSCRKLRWKKRQIDLSHPFFQRAWMQDSHITKYHFPLMLHVRILAYLHGSRGIAQWLGTPWDITKFVLFLNL